jgi:SAM-dependent methyltransferase
MASQFEDIADVYDRILDDAPYRRFVELPSVLAVLGDVAGLRVLDLGCGSGIYSRLLAKRGALVTGLDQSPAMIAQARRAEAAESLGIRYLLGDAATDRSVVATCDLVLGNYLLPYAFTPEALLAMCTTARAALSGPGGRFVAMTPNPDMPTTLPGSLQKYGVEAAVDGTAPSDGDILRVRARVGGRPLDLTAC